MANEKEKSEKKNQEAAPQEETVVVSKVQLTEILKKVEALEASNARLSYAADRGRLDQFDNANKPKELTRVRLNVYENPDDQSSKVVMAWKMIMDEVVYDRVRGYIEKQIIELTLEDDTKVQISYGDFGIGKRRKQEQSEIVSRKKDEKTGHELLSLRRISDGKEYEIDSRFIN